MQSEALEIRRLADRPDEIRALQSVLEAAPGYERRVSGRLPSPDAARELLSSLPPGKTMADKVVFGIDLGEQMVGCVDVVHGYPVDSTAMVGLFLLSEAYQGQGLGTAAYWQLERILRGWEGCRRVRIGVVATNARGLPFWQKLGFVPTGERKPYEHGHVVSEVIVLEKPIP